MLRLWRDAGRSASGSADCQESVAGNLPRTEEIHTQAALPASDLRRDDLRNEVQDAQSGCLSECGMEAEKCVVKNRAIFYLPFFRGLRKSEPRYRLLLRLVQSQSRQDVGAPGKPYHSLSGGGAKSV